MEDIWEGVGLRMERRGEIAVRTVGPVVGSGMMKKRERAEQKEDARDLARTEALNELRAEKTRLGDENERLRLMIEVLRGSLTRLEADSGKS